MGTEQEYEEMESMGDRISIQFVNRGRQSVAFFSHWDGMLLKKKAKDYAHQLLMDKANGVIDSSSPLFRLEPNVVMVDFICHYLHDMGPRIDDAYYLGADSRDGDNGDNGNFLIHLDMVDEL